MDDPLAKLGLLDFLERQQMRSLRKIDSLKLERIQRNDTVTVSQTCDGQRLLKATCGTCDENAFGDALRTSALTFTDF